MNRTGIHWDVRSQTARRECLKGTNVVGGKSAGGFIQSIRETNMEKGRKSKRAGIACKYRRIPLPSDRGPDTALNDASYPTGMQLRDVHLEPELILPENPNGNMSVPDRQFDFAAVEGDFRMAVFDKDD